MKRTLLWKRARRGRQYYVLLVAYHYVLVDRYIKLLTDIPIIKSKRK